MTVDIVLVFDDPDSLCSTYFLLVDMWFLPSIISFARNSFWLVDRCPQPHQQCHHQNNVVVTFSRCEYITQSAPSTKATNLKQKNTISTHANCDPARRFSVFPLVYCRQKAHSHSSWYHLADARDESHYVCIASMLSAHLCNCIRCSRHVRCPCCFTKLKRPRHFHFLFCLQSKALIVQYNVIFV